VMTKVNKDNGLGKLVSELSLAGQRIKRTCSEQSESIKQVEENGKCLLLTDEGVRDE
jgi:hypothetical protein